MIGFPIKIRRKEKDDFESKLDIGRKKNMIEVVSNIDRKRNKRHDRVFVNQTHITACLAQQKL